MATPHSKVKKSPQSCTLEMVKFYYVYVLYHNCYLQKFLNNKDGFLN